MKVPGLNPGRVAPELLKCVVVLDLDDRSQRFWDPSSPRETVAFENYLRCWYTNGYLHCVPLMPGLAHSSEALKPKQLGPRLLCFPLNRVWNYETWCHLQVGARRGAVDWRWRSSKFRMSRWAWEAARCGRAEIQSRLVSGLTSVKCALESSLQDL